MSKTLEGKIALVTGATSGIGRAAAMIMARDGARVVAVGRREREGQETADLVQQAGGECEFVGCDVTDPGQVRELFEHLKSIYGRLDCAFNNAGVLTDTGRIHEMSDGDFSRALTVNVRGTWNCLKAELAMMVEQGGGSIVNDSSLNGLRASLHRPAYTATKHAVVGLTRSAALDYARDGIRVNAVCPGPIDTAMMGRIDSGSEDARRRIERSVPMGRYGTPEEVGELVSWLCSDASSYLTGQALSVDGGITAR